MNCPKCKKFMSIVSFEKQIATRPDGTKCYSRFSGNACVCGYRKESCATLNYWKREAQQGRAILLPEFSTVEA